MKRILLLFTAILIAWGPYAEAQERTVTGTVTAEADGTPVPGVNVILKGTSIGTVTDIDGKFQIRVPQSGAVLVFSFIGLATEEVLVGAQSIIDMVMTADIKQLTEIVVTGYSNQVREKLSGSVSVVGAQAIENVPMPSFDQILQGRTPGLLVTAGSGQPGTGATVRIRGSGSINASNEPLYIVDGVPIEGAAFATINPNDFESVSVLKDASASALYGSRGANGVIVVTTKSGKAGEMRINYRHQNGWSQQARERFNMMNSAQKIAFERFVGVGPNAGLNPLDPTDAAEIERLSNIDVNWKDVFIRTGRTQEHELNFSGGNDKTNYYISVNYFDQEGQALRSGLKRYTTRFNLTSNLSNKIIIGTNSTIGWSNSSFIESEGSVTLANPFAAAYLANPYEEQFNPETGAINTGAGRTGPNAYDRIVNSTNDRNELKAVMSMFAEVNLLENLTAKTIFGVDYRQRDFERWIDPLSFAGRNTAPGGAGLLTNAFNRRLQWVSTSTLDYKYTLNNMHEFNAVVGIEALERTFNAFSATGYGLNPKLPLSNAGITTSPELVPALGGSWSGNKLFSVFSILNYTYDSKLNFTGTLRRDGSSRFGVENQYAVLWSVAGSYNLHRESFLENTFVDVLKVRASYGKSGNQEFTPENSGDFRSLTTYASTDYNGIVGFAPSTVGDANYRWEISNQLNVGVDFGLLNNRIDGSIDVYNNITSDLFITEQLSRTTGFSAIQRNAGKMRNRGIELALNGTVINSNNFSWTIGGNFTFNDNEILDLGQVDEFEQGTAIIRVGLPLGSHYIVEWAGVDPNTGAPLYRDIDGNVTTQYSQDNNVANFGTWIAPIFGGLNTNLKYKGFNLDVFFTYMYDVQRFNNQRFFQENHNFAIYNLSTVMLDMWKQPGDITDIQSFRYPREFSSKDIEDASFLRLRNVVLSYNVPGKLLNQVGFIKNARVFAQGQNLLTFTNFNGFDPEDSNNIAQYEFPASRILTLGIDVTF
ncbi:MAG: TonB-dependent receptor [Cyclobacteriaceae bacterium]|nr:TonB-dependent receptor [Cyclobacteriaceae bacterium]